MARETGRTPEARWRTHPESDPRPLVEGEPLGLEPGRLAVEPRLDVADYRQVDRHGPRWGAETEPRRRRWHRRVRPDLSHLAGKRLFALEPGDVGERVSARHRRAHGSGRSRHRPHGECAFPRP